MKLSKLFTASVLTTGMLIYPCLGAAENEGLSLSRKTPGVKSIGSLQLTFDGLLHEAETRPQVYSYNAPTGRSTFERSTVYDLGFIPRRVIVETPETTVQYSTRQVPTGRTVWNLTSSTSGYSLRLVLDGNGKITGVPTLFSGVEQNAQTQEVDLEIIQLIHQHKSNSLASGINFLPLILESVTPANPLSLKFSVNPGKVVVTKASIAKVSAELGQALNSKRNYSGAVNCSANVIASTN